MHFPSDSWGKFGAETKAIMKILRKDGHYVPLGDMQELNVVMEEIFKKPSFSSMTRVEIMKHILEGLKMPVHNPKTGEQDYVDVSLVNKIVVDSEYVEDMVSNSKIKIDINLAGSADIVTVTAGNKELNATALHEIPVQFFEEMLFKAINEVKDQRLEEVEDFKGIVDTLVSTIVNNSRVNNVHLARLGEDYVLQRGIGIIRDIKANQDIGTFEDFEYQYDKSRRLVNIEGVILSGRVLEDLKEKDRFEFVYYSLEQGLSYSIITGEKASVRIDTKEPSIDIEKYDLLIQKFDDTHTYYQIVKTAQEKKAIMEGIDQSHPLYDTNLVQFRQSRLDILEESKDKQKKEKLVSQFADIEIDL